jgi:hypothetical protein
MKLEVKKYLFDIHESILSIENIWELKGISIYIWPTRCFAER